MQIIHRRNFLVGAATALGSLPLTSACASISGESPRFFRRGGLQIGLQIYTLGPDAGRDLDATFAQVAAIGIRDIELPGLFGRSPADVRAAANKAGIAISSLHLSGSNSGGVVPGLMLTSPPSQIAEALGTLGARFAVLPMALFPAGFRRENPIDESFKAAGDEPWKRTAALLNDRAFALKSSGVTVAYHNHNFEFAPLDIGKTGWDILLDELDPAVKLEIDVGWVAAAGLDPSDFLARYRSRAALLHVKDIAKGMVPNFRLTMQPAEIGSGAQDWARILPAALASGVQHFYIEQEPPFTMARIDAVRKSYEYLDAFEG